MPALKRAKANVGFIASSGGLSSTVLAKKFNIPKSTSDYHQILQDPNVGLVLATTQHNSHASLVNEKLKAGKNSFVEKPLCIKESDIDKIIFQYNKSNNSISVGFNRRFGDLAIKMKELIGSSEVPINITATFNAGFIPSDNWVHDLDIGGGRILGEACHFIDLCTYLTGSMVEKVCMSALTNNPQKNTDNASILLKYENGSNVVINYFSNGSKSYSKERIEVYSQEKTLILDNWRQLLGYGFKNFTKIKQRQDKGHLNQFIALVNQQKEGGSPIIAFDEIINTTKASFAALRSLKERRWISLK